MFISNKTGNFVLFIIFNLSLVCFAENYIHQTKIDINNYVTASNHRYFYRLINLIGSIHGTNFENTNLISVYNLGLEQKEIEFLNGIEKITIEDVELVHPDLLTDFDTRSEKNNRSKPVPGWYAWKPVIFKQSLEKFPLFLFIDAGSTVLKPLDVLFNHILDTGYFLHSGAPRKIWQHATKYVKNLFDLETTENNWILDSYGLETGLMGITPKIYENLIFPIYEMAKEISPFIDDGTCPGGFGNGRHEQTLFSILALKLGLKIHYHNINPQENFGLISNNTSIEFNIACPPYVTSNTHISCSRTHYEVETYFSQIHFKEDAKITNIMEFKKNFSGR